MSKDPSKIADQVTDSFESSNITFHHVNDFERYTDSSTFPTDEDDVLIDAMASKSKGAVVFSRFGSPSVCSMSVTSAQPLSVDTSIDKSRVMPNVLPTKVRSVTEFAISSKDVDATIIKGVTAPQRPHLVLPCHFITDKSLENVVELLRKIFDDEYSEIDYEFIEHECSFNAVYVKGSRYCDFRLRIYENTGKKGLLIELQRLHKDSCGFTFKHIFESVKRTVSNADTSPTSTVDLSDHSISGVGPCLDFSSLSLSLEVSTTSQLTDEEISDSIQQVLAMASEPNEQSQLEACRILCDLSDEKEIRQRMADTNCVKTLVNIMKSERVLLRQHAVLALAQLSECQECMSAIVESGAIPYLFSFAGNGPYYTGVMRRESARIIANIASKKAMEITASVGKEELESWPVLIDKVEDATIKERLERANAYLQQVSAAI